MMRTHGDPQREARALIALALALAILWALLLAALFWATTSFAHAAEAVVVTAAPDSTPAIVLPWGELVIQLLQGIALIAVPALAAVIGGALRQVAPWATLILTQDRIQTMIQNVTDHGINAVDGALKGKQLSVPVASAVIAHGVQRAIDAAPGKVLEAAGGPAGVAERIFRTLDLSSNATFENVVGPVLANIRAAEAVRVKG